MPKPPAVPSHFLNRRRFLQYSMFAAGGTALGAPAILRAADVGNKLNIGVIGAGGKGTADSGGVSGENIVALCDVDEKTLQAAAKKYPGAKLYRDYRKMLAEQKDIEAVTVSTPDHHHFFASMMAIKTGRHVYCQKPLTHSIWEARALTQAAAKAKVATQMGNQGHSGDGNRALCEIIWAGTIGAVREVHCWTNRPIWPQGLDRPAGSDPVPENLDWDLWIGPAPMRPFKAAEPGAKRGGFYHPFAWRGWWDFGAGALGDMGCHVMDGAYWALKLGHATSVEVVEASDHKPECAPNACVLKYEFPARGEMPPVTLYWHDGGKLPPRPEEMDPSEKFEQSGSLFIGEKGKMLTGTYGEKPRLLPLSRMADFVLPAKTIPRVIQNNPYLDWIQACKGGTAACSNFSVAGPFTEAVLLGNVALRAGRKIIWDGPKMKAKNAPETAKLIHRDYRAGWKV
jgi:predicted dehydrogenase